MKSHKQFTEQLLTHPEIKTGYDAAAMDRIIHG